MLVFKIIVKLRREICPELNYAISPLQGYDLHEADRLQIIKLTDILIMEVFAMSAVELISDFILLA